MWKNKECTRETYLDQVEDAIEFMCRGQEVQTKDYSKWMGYFHAIMTMEARNDTLSELTPEDVQGENWSETYNKIKKDYMFKPLMSLNPNIYICGSTGEYKSLIHVDRLFGYRLNSNREHFITYAYTECEKRIRPALVTVGDDGTLAEVTMTDMKFDKAAQELKDAGTLGYSNAEFFLPRTKEDIALVTLVADLDGATAIYKTHNRLRCQYGITADDLEISYEGERL